MKMLLITCLTLMSVLINPVLHASIKCDAEAAKLFERGSRADADSRLDDARSLYTQAAQRCDRYSYWMAVGNIWVNDYLGDSVESVNEEGGPAIEAYANAFEVARRDGNKMEGAEAARAMVELGLRAGDPIKANDWLLLAQNLDPSSAALDELQREVDFARAELSTSEIETGFSQTRGLGQVHGLLMSGTGGSAYWDANSDSASATAERVIATTDTANTSGTGQGRAEVAAAANAARSINIPINFQPDSTRTTAQTAKNIENLAMVLASGSESGEILFIGHADVRGDADYNMWLSRKRADSVRLELEALQPSLVGRISAVGRGELEPVDRGASERAHANNRRLEIVIKD